MKKIFAMAIVAIAAVSANASTVEATWEAEPAATHPIPPVEVAAEPVAWQPEAGFPVACHPESFPVGSWPKEPVKVLA